MSPPNAQAGAISFAHLAGITTPVHAKAEAPADKDDDKDAKAQGEDETDEQYAKRMEDEEDEKAAKSKADANEDDEQPEDDKKDDKAKKAGARAASPLARGVAQERARWVAVVGSRAFARNAAVGAHLLASTSMDAGAILAVLRDTPATASGDGGRAARNPSIGTGAAAAPTGPAANEARWAAAAKRAGIA